MLNTDKQLELDFSPYSQLYDILIEKSNFWRRLDEAVDFRFVIDEIQNNYTASYGRLAVDPIFMFKLLLLKESFRLSDRDLIKMLRVNMEMKFFLHLAPEETDLIDPSLLSKFRKLRMTEENLLDKLIQTTIHYALEKGIMNARSRIVVDSTHTMARYQHVSPRQELLNRCKELRKTVYAVNPSMHDKMPSKKLANTGNLEDTISYCQQVIEVVRKEPELSIHPKTQERMNYLEEGIQDTETELEYSREQDARIGHKTADTSFFGFKSHLAMDADTRIITAATVTSGEKHDGKQLPDLIEKTKNTGLEVEAVIGDGAYAERGNLEMGKKEGVKIIARLSENVLHGNRKDDDKFEFNKDAGMYVCPNGNMAVRKAKGGQKKAADGSNTQVITYYFDVETCKHCPHRKGCYKEGAKSKTYSVKIKDDLHTEQMDFMKTEEYQEGMSHRYKIEAKNAELKQNYGYGKASGCGLRGMTIQAEATIFLSNMKRIFKLMDKPREECAQNSGKDQNNR